MSPALGFISSKKDDYFMMLFCVTFGGARDEAWGSPHTELELIIGTLSNHRFWKKRLLQLTPREENWFFKESERKCACVEGP